MGTMVFPGAKPPGFDVNHPPNLGPRLKKEYSYTSTAPLGLYSLLCGQHDIWTGQKTQPTVKNLYYNRTQRRGKTLK
jgi:hypothetical protein